MNVIKILKPIQNLILKSYKTNSDKILNIFKE